MLQRFTAESGIEVNLDTYSSNKEMLAKIQAGAEGYDIVFPSVHMQDIMVKLDLLEKTALPSSQSHFASRSATRSRSGWRGCPNAGVFFSCS